GAGVLGRSRPPRTIPERQAAAAVGQIRLMRLYAECFAAHGLEVGQVLLTNDVVLDRRRFVNARNALAELFELGVVPIVNENDTVSVEEIRVGDNDNLAAYTAALVDADLLALLTDVAGVLAGEAAEPIARAESVEALRRHCRGKGSAMSVGGMTTKLDAAEKAARYGIPTVIASGLDVTALQAIYAGDEVGTRIDGWARRLPALRHWMAMQARVQGTLIVDDGALNALLGGGRSLLPRGVVDVVGRFERGDIVAIVDAHGVERARGVVAYDDTEIARIRGRHSSEIELVLGYKSTDEVVRAEKLVILRR
ncbi:MAG: glutamate 5-kinase, partial [Longimicrobiales bacterium]